MDKDHGAREGAENLHALPNMVDAQADDVPDPDEEDLDGLDDMLDEFALAQNPGPRHVPSTEAVAPRDKDPPAPEGAQVEDFAQQLQAQMAAFMGDMDDSPEMKRELEGMMKDLGAAVQPDASSTEKSEPKLGSKSSGGEEPFQETIRKTMERMQASNTEAENAAPADTSDDFLAQMLKSMPTNDALGGDDQEGFDKMLLGMMEQLTNKEILYEPMKELHDKFPQWMLKNATSIKPEDSSRYHEQQKLVNEIVGRFEQKSYSDSNPGDREFIVDRMQKMQAAGSPPADLVGDMDVASAKGELDPSCPQQ